MFLIMPVQKAVTVVHVFMPLHLAQNIEKLVANDFIVGIVTSLQLVCHYNSRHSLVEHNM
jgi:hypothetical protein